MTEPGAYVRLITPGELKSWIIYEDSDLIAVDKPAGVVCHPSKAGPWSSLAGAVREHFGLAAAHLVTRLDRETSGVTVFARNPGAAGRLQGAMSARTAAKSYLAVLTGALAGPVTVAQPLGPDLASLVKAKMAVVPGGQAAVTHFTPLARGNGFTLARAVTETGRKHQIRAHALWLGLPLVGDKIYGPDARLFLEFIETGWTPALEAALLLPRQALHCAELDLRAGGADRVFCAPLPPDLRAFCAARGLPVPAGL
jgi:23S rRNA pseudouridine1911/1915/1917 synthase